jgi:hypothetical protein
MICSFAEVTRCACVIGRRIWLRFGIYVPPRINKKPSNFVIMAFTCQRGRPPRLVELQLSKAAIEGGNGICSFADGPRRQEPGSGARAGRRGARTLPPSGTARQVRTFFLVFHSFFRIPNAVGRDVRNLAPPASAADR